MEKKFCIFCEKEGPTIQCELMCKRMFHIHCLTEPHLFKKGASPEFIQCLECLHNRKRCALCEHLVLFKERIKCIKCENWFHPCCLSNHHLPLENLVCGSHTCKGNGN